MLISAGRNSGSTFCETRTGCEVPSVRTIPNLLIAHVEASNVATAWGPAAPYCECMVVYEPVCELLIRYMDSALNTNRPGRPTMSMPIPTPSAVSGVSSFSRTSMKSPVSGGPAAYVHVCASPAFDHHTRGDTFEATHTLSCQIASAEPLATVVRNVSEAPVEVKTPSEGWQTTSSFRKSPIAQVPAEENVCTIVVVNRSVEE